MQQKALLLLGARRGQLTAILTARDMGLDVIAIDPDPSAPGLSLATLAYVHDLADRDAILKVAKSHRIDGVMTMAADYPMPTIGCICAECRLPGPSPEVVARATNKRLMREALVAGNVGCPRFFHVVDADQAKQAVASLGGDTIFKPAMSNGGRGVTRVPAGSHDETILRAFQRALLETRDDGVMVEEFIDGPEFSVECLAYRGKVHVVAVTDKLTSGPPYYVELGHNQPSRWPIESVADLHRTATAAVAALGIDNAASHVEIRLSKMGPFIMEAAARLGGGFITSHLVPLSTGIALVAATIQVALGQEPDLKPRSPGRSVAIRFMHAQPGIVVDIEGVETVRQIQGVEEVDVYVQENDSVSPLLDSSARLGHVICCAASAEEAIALAESAVANVHVRTKQQ